MNIRLVLGSAVLAVLPLAATADVLVTHDGLRIETEGPWEVQGRIVVFTALGETSLSSLRLSEVDLEASKSATAEIAAAIEAAERAEAEKPDDEEPATLSPLTLALLEAYSKEQEDAVREIGHNTVSGKRWTAFRREVAEALERLDELQLRYDLQNPEAMRRARSTLASVAYRLRELLLRPLPRDQRTLEGRQAVKETAQYLEQLAILARRDPHLAIQVMNQNGGLP